MSVSIATYDHAPHLHSVVMPYHEMKYVKVEYIIHTPENAKRNARLLARGGIVLGIEGRKVQYSPQERRGVVISVPSYNPDTLQLRMPQRLRFVTSLDSSD